MPDSPMFTDPLHTEMREFRREWRESVGDLIGMHAKELEALQHLKEHQIARDAATDARLRALEQRRSAGEVLVDAVAKFLGASEVRKVLAALLLLGGVVALVILAERSGITVSWSGAGATVATDEGRDNEQE